jgi:hypothetical protein
MVDALQQTATSAASAAQVIIDQGVIGALLIISLTANVALFWRLSKANKRLIDHLESHERSIK